MTTVDSREKAESIAKELIEDYLAACVQIDGPLSSAYLWQGTVEHALEFRISIKTSIERVPAVTAELSRLHPYELPEILWQTLEATESYASWVQSSIGSKG